MSIAVISGSAGLIGSEASEHFHGLGYDVWGIDNDLRASFFGPEASTLWRRDQLRCGLKNYRHHQVDIRDKDAIDAIFRSGRREISLVIHTAAQPSHDWAAGDPATDFSINANGTLHLLDATRRFAPEAAFVFTSTNKVYGDRPNLLPLAEQESRFELGADHEWFNGIPETMAIDESTHSLFGVSKAAADLLVQEYGRYFGLRTACFRGGCLTGPGHSGAQLHGFLAYLMKCAVTGVPYTVFGYRGKQVRDNIHSADLVSAFEQVARKPPKAGVYNIGGGRFSHCSMLEAIGLCEAIAGRPLTWSYSPENRVGDHLWWISDLSRFRSEYPDWNLRYDVPAILEDIYQSNAERWLAAS